MKLSKSQNKTSIRNINSKKMKKSHCQCVILLKVVIAVFCVGLFIALMGDVWIKFNSKTTHTGSRFVYNKLEKKKLPCLTICPMPAFKVHFDERKYEENIYQLEDIFGPKTKTQLMNESKFTVRGTFLMNINHQNIISTRLVLF